MSGVTPTQIALHQKSRVLEIHFNNGSEYHLPCEYLRVFSPSAEVKAAKNRGEIIRARPDINITAMEPIGAYALRIVFNDGHRTGVYSWQTLKELGEKQEANWSQYQRQLTEAEIEGSDDRA
jgi:DUF971 family protein